MKEVKFEVKGIPKGKERPRFGANGVVYTPKNTLNYEEIVQLEYLKQVGGYQLKGTISAEIYAYFEPSKSISMKKKESLLGKPFDKKPDADNIAKIVLDALNGVAYKDDSKISQLIVNKMYGKENKIAVRLKEIEII